LNQFYSPQVEPDLEEKVKCDVRVTVATSLAAVDLVKVGERKVETLAEGDDLVSDLAVRKRDEFIEQRLNDGREDSGNEELEDDPIHREVVGSACPLEQFEMQGDCRRHIERLTGTP
jgi:hypothetical protein